MNKHCQINNFNYTFPIVVLVGKKDKKVNNLLSVDQFFAQPHLLCNGFIDTSPELAENPATQGHMFPLQGPQLPKRTDDELLAMNVSKHCQTLAEVSALAKSLRPDVDVNDPSVEDSSELITQPSETE